MLMFTQARRDSRELELNISIDGDDDDPGRNVVSADQHELSPAPAPLT
jgi:hypothetical protein